MPDRLDERWDRCKAAIGRFISPEDAAAWLPPLHLCDVAPDRIVLDGVPNTFFRNRISSRFGTLILENLREAFPEVAFARDPSLVLRVGPGAGALPAGVATGPAGAGTHPHSGAAANGADEAAPYTGTLDTFLPAPGNSEALHFAREIAAAPGKRFNPLLLVGGTGLGKTHLLQGVAHALRSRGVDALYVSGEQFRNEVLDAITRKRMQPLRDRYRSAPALLVDDLAFLPISPKAQEELLHTFDALHGRGHQLVLAADRLPRELPGLSDALRSRLEMGLVVELGAPDVAARGRMVQQWAAEARVTLPAAVVALLAERITHDTRRLEGAVIRLRAYAGLYGEAITRSFAERIAAPFFDAAEPDGALPVARDAILERVADRCGVTVRALKGRGRSPNLTAARRVAVHLLKTLGNCSYAEVGALLGNRSHSTMVHAHQRLQAAMADDERLLRKVQALAHRIGSAAAAD